MGGQGGQEAQGGKAGAEEGGDAPELPEGGGAAGCGRRGSAEEVGGRNLAFHLVLVTCISYRATVMFVSSGTLTTLVTDSATSYKESILPAAYTSILNRVITGEISNLCTCVVLGSGYSHQKSEDKSNLHFSYGCLMKLRIPCPM